MRFAKWTFWFAGVTGVLMIIPPYFQEERFGHDFPPPIEHRELYYGFLGVTFAWQIMFLIIASDPVRYRPTMLAAMIEKASFSFAMPVLFLLDRVPGVWLWFAAIDGMWLMLFVVAYVRTPRDGPSR